MNFDDTYNEAIKLSCNLIQDVRFNRDTNIDPIIACTEHICEYLHSNSNILILSNYDQDKNPYLYSHPVHVAFVSYVIGKWMKLKKSELSKLVFTGMVHDIGKAKIKDRILNEAGKLTEQEMKIMKSHTMMGHEILSSRGIQDSDILSGVLSHHERYDGTGYPNKLRGDQISLFAKIIGIADVYDAITSQKSYDLKRTPFKAAEEIQADSFGLLDPKVCQIFLQNISDSYSGAVVRLSNELVGKIVYVNPEEKTKPLIQCENEYINLTRQRDIEIVELLK